MADNKYMYCVADGYVITAVIYRAVRDRGCLTGAVR